MEGASEPGQLQALLEQNTAVKDKCIQVGWPAALHAPQVPLDRPAQQPHCAPRCAVSAGTLLAEQVHHTPARCSTCAEQCFSPLI